MFKALFYLSRAIQLVMVLGFSSTVVGLFTTEGEATLVGFGYVSVVLLVFLGIGLALRLWLDPILMARADADEKGNMMLKKLLYGLLYCLAIVVLVYIFMTVGKR